MDTVRNEFARLVAGDEAGLHDRLAESALWIAKAIDGQVDVDEQLARLDQLAAELASSTAPELALELFGGAAHRPSVHFAGNRAGYYELDNSLLHRVLDRRMGIPITLSILLIDVGRRRGVTLTGVGMPGHFLVAAPEGYIDPFNHGVLLDEDGCLAVFRQLAGPGALLPPGSLTPVSPCTILRRVLANLAGISRRTNRKHFRSVSSLVAALPDADHRDHAQHGFAAAAVGQFDEAARAAERALELSPEQLHARLTEKITEWQARLN